MIKKNALLWAFCLLFCFQVNAQTTPKYPSLLWKITGNGLSKPSYLYGTMHVSSKIAFHLGDSFFVALKNADGVALESDPSFWLAEMLHTQDEHELSHEIFNRNNSFDFYKNAFYLPIIQNNMLRASLARNPELLNGMMYRFSGRGQDFEEETYLDLFIYQSGHRLKKQVIGLEDFAEVDSLLKLAYKKGNEDEENEEEEKNRRALKKIRKEGKNAYEMLEDAYRRGDLDMLDSIQRLMNGSVNYQKYMLEERNKIMAHRMDSLMPNISLFTGIGAAHLAGNMGVIELLRSKGYTLTPVMQHYGKLSKKSKEKIESLAVSRTFKTQKSTDGSFEVDLPGTLYEFPEDFFVKEYFYPDLANGAFYSIRRLRTYAPLIGYTADKMQAKVDSLLFENIPGKHQYKKKSTLNGYATVEVLTKLKKGDYQRYLLVFTPIEVYIFRAGGRKDYVYKGEGAKFFKSIKMNIPGETHKTYSTYNGDVRINMPEGTFHDETDVRMKRIFSPEKTFQGYEAKSGAYFMLKRSSLHDVNYIEEDTFELARLADNFFKKYTFEDMIAHQMGHTTQQYPCYTVHRKQNNQHIFVRWVIKGPHYFLLSAVTPDSLKAYQFFESLVLGAPKQYNTFKEETDTLYHYQVSSPVKPRKQNRYNYDYAANNRNKKNNDHLEKTAKQLYVLTQSDEEITVEYTRTHKYAYYENADSLWLHMKKEESRHNSLHWSKAEFDVQDSVLSWQVLLSDTGSTRGIMAKYVVKNRIIYALKANIDTLQGPSAFVQTFFATFTPSDTAIGLSLFTNKAALFFEDLWGTDSVAQEHALKSIGKIRFENQHTAALIKTIKYFNHKAFGTEDKADLVYKLGKLKDPLILPFFKAYYMATVDTPLVQVNILQALGKQKSPEAIALFKELIAKETPLLHSSYEVANIFWAINDSLPLAKKTYPFIMDFTRYPEYRPYVYRFVSELLDSGTLNKKDLEKYKTQFIAETKDDIKRQQASDQKTQYSYQSHSSQNNFTLIALAKLITPFYDENEVKRVFDKLQRLDNDEIRFALGKHMLKNKLPQHDSLWNYLAKKDAFRLRVYEALKENNSLDKLNDTLVNQEQIARAVVYKNHSVSDKDTIEFLSKVAVTVKGEAGYIYFFKRKKTWGNNNWYLDYSGLQPTDSTDLNLRPKITHKGSSIDMYDDIDEQLEKIIDEIRFADRRRYSGSATSDSDYMYYDEDEVEYADE